MKKYTFTEIMKAGHEIKIFGFTGVRKLTLVKLKQLSGLQELFKDSNFSRAWE